jgi:DNA polymerase III epsilon subunit-like protein
MLTIPLPLIFAHQSTVQERGCEMLHLIFDTETTGLPKDYKAHVHDVENWPRVVQLAWTLLDDDFVSLTSRNHILFGVYDIPDAAAEIHGITTARAEAEGVPADIALTEFAMAQEIADIQVGHNVNFDRKNLGAEFIRSNMDHVYEEGKVMARCCTMFKSTKLCALRNSRGGMKWPTLQELYFHLFDHEFDGAHDALADVMATSKCYQQLIELSIVDPEMIVAETRAKHLGDLSV